MGRPTMYIWFPYKPGNPLFLPYKTGRRLVLTDLLSPVVNRLRGVFGFIRIPDKTASSLEHIGRALHANKFSLSTSRRSGGAATALVLCLVLA